MELKQKVFRELSAICAPDRAARQQHQLAVP